MLLERAHDLEPEPGRTREDLAEFRFGSYAGVGLNPARASWLREYLEAVGGRLDERPAGPLALFTGSVMAALERPGETRWDDALAGEVFVPWYAGYDAEVEPRWLKTHVAPVRDVLHEEPGPGLLGRLRAAREPLGLRPVPLPIAPALYVLPLLAHHDEARAELGDRRFEPALALARDAIADAPEALTVELRQELELLCLGAAGFGGASGHTLVRTEPPGLVVWAADGAPAAALVGTQPPPAQR